MTSLVDAMTYDRIDTGKGIVRSQKLKRQPVETLTKGANPFDLNEPNIGEEVILIDKKKVVKLSVSNTLMHDIGVNVTMITDAITSIDALVQETKDMELYGEAVDLYNSYTPGQATQKVVIDQYTGGVNIGAGTDMHNAMQIAKTIRNSMISMSRPSGAFIDVTEWTVDGKTVTGLETISKRDDLLLFVNSAVNTNLIIDAFATLYHDTDIRNIVGGIVEVPVDDLTNKNHAFRLAHKDKHAIAYYYDLVMNIVNPRDTYTNTFGHYAYGTGTFKLLPSIDGELNIITP